jgi:hypothetical protein
MKIVAPVSRRGTGRRIQPLTPSGIRTNQPNQLERPNRRRGERERFVFSEKQEFLLPLILLFDPAAAAD